MTFRVDMASRRVVDDEFHLELVRRGSGPRAWRSFEIVGAGKSIAFLAVQRSSHLPFGDNGELVEMPCWNICFNEDFSPDERALNEQIVADAMIAHRSSFGIGRPEWIYTVHFLPWGTDIE